MIDYLAIAVRTEEKMDESFKKLQSPYISPSFSTKVNRVNNAWLYILTLRYILPFTKTRPGRVCILQEVVCQLLFSFHLSLCLRGR